MDLDGTILEHNGYLHGEDKLLPGALKFAKKAYETGMLILMTARSEEYRTETVLFLERAGILYHAILFDIPIGERILINDKKPSGLKTAFAVNIERDKGIDISIVIDEDL